MEMTITIDDQMIINAYNRLRNVFAKPDSPRDRELDMVRYALQIEDPEVINLGWLRNQIVRLRKAKKLKQQD